MYNVLHFESNLCNTGCEIRLEVRNWTLSFKYFITLQKSSMYLHVVAYLVKHMRMNDFYSGIIIKYFLVV